MMKKTCLLGIFLALILTIQTVILLYACLIWPASKLQNDTVFYMGALIFVTCSILPFALITGYLVIYNFTLITRTALLCPKKERVMHCSCHLSITIIPVDACIKKEGKHFFPHWPNPCNSLVLQ